MTGSRRGIVVLAALVGTLASTAAAADAAPRPLGRECVPQDGVRFCAGSVANRVPSFDRVPLDVDVTLPGTGDGPFPTLVMLHGLGGSKTDFEQRPGEGVDEPGTEGTRATTFHYNNRHYAQRGYAVVNYSARGFGDSCGSVTSRADPDCDDGFIHLADQRFEVRDTQHLLGLLVDEGIARPGALGVTGISYGGGQSAQLAFLRDRIRLPDGSFASWRSPRGTALAITAAYPRWLWSDLTYSLLPNGRFLDFELPSQTQSRDPLGVLIQSYVAGLFGVSQADGFVAPPGTTDQEFDLTRQFARVNAGEPYGEDVRAIGDALYENHSAAGLFGRRPAPLLLQDGWTDDLFPVHESLRIYNELRAGDPGFPVSLQFGDLGHSRGANKVNTDRFFNDQGVAFFDRHLRGVTSPAAPAPGSVTTFTQTCPVGAPGGGPFRASSWQALRRGTVRFASQGAQTVDSAGGDPAESQQIDPITGARNNPCVTVASDDDPGTAVVRLPAATGWTLMGRPTVRARIETTDSGTAGQLDALLWDVAPDGQERLITRSAYRLRVDQDGEVVFQLNGNGYRFAAGHVPKLQLVGRDAPYLRPSNGEFRVAVSNLRLELPTLEGPDGGQIGPPSAEQTRRPGAPGQGSSAGGQRRARPGLRVRVSPGRDRRGPRRFTTTGRLVLPRGVARGAGCEGFVSVQVKAGRNTISTRRAAVGSRCRFRSRVTFRVPRRFGGRSRLKFTARFSGNPALEPRQARRVFVRVR